MVMTAERGSIVSRLRAAVEQPGTPEVLFTRDEFADLVRERATVTSGYVPQQFREAVNKPRRGGRVAALANVRVQTEPEVVVSEEGAVTEVAGPVDFSTGSTESTVALTKVVLPETRIAAHVRSWQSVLEDSDELLRFVEFMLDRDVLRSVDNEILNGDGSGTGAATRFTGLANSSLPTQAVSAGTRWESLVNAAGKVRAADWHGPMSVVLNATDATELALEKGTAGESAIDDALTALQFLGVEQFVFTTIQTAGTGYVGSFSEGASLFVRQAPTIEISRSHQDDFVTGKAVAAIESRWSWRLHFPSAFVQVTGL